MGTHLSEEHHGPHLNSVLREGPVVGGEEHSRSVRLVLSRNLDFLGTRFPQTTLPKSRPCLAAQQRLPEHPCAQWSQEGGRGRCGQAAGHLCWTTLGGDAGPAC